MSEYATECEIVAGLVEAEEQARTTRMALNAAESTRIMARYDFLDAVQAVRCFVTDASGDVMQDRETCAQFRQLLNKVEELGDAYAATTQQLGLIDGRLTGGK